MGLLSVPKHYKPKGKPKEKLIYATPAEIRGLLAMTDGRAERTRHGVLSFADDSASSKGVSRGGSGATGSGSTKTSTGSVSKSSSGGGGSNSGSRPSGTSTAWGGGSSSGSKTKPSGTSTAWGGGGSSPTMRTETTVPGGFGMQGYSGLQRSYANPAVFSPNIKDQSRVPQQQAFNPGGSPYPDGQTPPTWPGSFPTADPRPVSRVAGGLGVQAYSPQGNSYQPKSQDRLPTPETMIARDPSLLGRAAQASASLFGGGVPGGYGMQAYETAFNPPQPSPAGNDGMVEGVTDGTGPGYTGGEGFVPESTNPVTNTARTIAARLSGPAAKIDQKLGSVFPGMKSYTPNTPVGSNSGGGQASAILGGASPQSGHAVPGAPTPPPVTPPGTPPPPNIMQLLYPQYYTQYAAANLPKGAYQGRTI